MGTKRLLGVLASSFLALWALVAWWEEGGWLLLFLFVAYAVLGLVFVVLPYSDSVEPPSEGPRSDGRTSDGRQEDDK